jgi:transposase InsO family protein
LDLYTRKIIGWSMRETLHSEIALQALTMAIVRQPPAPRLIHHSDRGILLEFNRSSQQQCAPIS